MTYTAKNYKNYVAIDCKSIEEYNNGIENLKNAGFSLLDDSFAASHYETNNTLYTIWKNW